MTGGTSSISSFHSARGDHKRPAREAKGFAAEQFLVDGEQQQVTCPQGCTSQSWTPAQDRKEHPVIKIKFADSDGRVCPCLRDGTHTKRSWRTITLHPQPEHEALRAARQRQREPEFTEQYGKRAGMEGAISPGVRLRMATSPFSGAGQNPLAAHSHGYFQELGTHRPMAGRRIASTNAPVVVCQALASLCCLNEFASREIFRRVAHDRAGHNKP